MLHIINIASGNLHIDSMRVILARGERLTLDMSRSDALQMHSDLILFEERGRVMIMEDAVPVQPEQKVLDPQAPEAPEAPQAPEAVPANSLEEGIPNENA